MFRKVNLLLLLFLSLAVVAQGQNDTVKRPPLRLIYYVDETTSTPFLVPFIETYLKDLTYSNKELQPVYSDVISLNILFENRKIEGKIIDAFIHADRNQTSLGNSKPRDMRDAEVANSLLNYDKFLVIKIRSFNSLLEYQFLMYDVLKNNEEGVKDSPVLKSYRSSSVFVDPQSPNHKDELIFALKQVCAEVNERPKAEIRVNGYIPKSSADTVYLSVTDTAFIEGIAIDPDSPKERLGYTWSVSRESLYGQIAYGKQKQSIKIDTSAIITIGVVISDGIGQSDKTEVTVEFIYPPQITVEEMGNTILDWNEWDLTEKDMIGIRDDVKKNEYWDIDFLYRKNVFGKKRFLHDEDSLVIFYSRGDLRLSKSNARDSLLRSTVKVRNQVKDTMYYTGTDTAFSKEYLKKGQYATIRFYPGRVLGPDKFQYTFYVTDRGIKSENLNMQVQFIKIRSLSLWNEYVFSTLGYKKGMMGNALLGVNWQPFGTIQFGVAASYLFAPSKRIHKNEGDQIETSGITARYILEFMRPKKLEAHTWAILVQQFNILSEEGKIRRDRVWGIGYRGNVPLLSLGYKGVPYMTYHYFPNFNKRSYISGFGIFEMSIGMKLYSFKTKK